MKSKQDDFHQTEVLSKQNMNPNLVNTDPIRSEWKVNALSEPK